jgi:predicted Zn-dependent protease
MVAAARPFFPQDATTRGHDMGFFRHLPALLCAAALVGTAAPARAQSPEEMQQIIQQFGGVYQDPDLQKYVNSVGQLIAAASDKPDQKYSYTVLDTAIVNAFALPNGSIFVTRGLIDLANSEAELASVLGHETGHVVAGHSASRQTRGTIAEIGAGLLGALLGSPQIGNLAGVGAELYLQHYSREQELEADTLGLRYMGRAGYDQRAAVRFLKSLEAQSALESKILGTPQGDLAYNMMSDHPRTVDRVERAAQVAGNHPPQGEIDRAIYFKKIDGVVDGDDPDEGVVRDHTFMHPKLRFAFSVPDGFQIANGTTQVVAHGPNGAAIIFDRNPKPFSGSAVDYLTRGWAAQVQLGNLEKITVNGMEAATATAKARTQSGATVDARLVAIRFDPNTFYRFVFLTPPELTARLATEFRRTTYSFHRLSESEAASVKPYRIKVVTVQQGDTVESLSKKMPFDRLQTERFLVLNGLGQGAALKAGTQVKIVVD